VNEAAVIHRVLSGDRDAFRVLVVRYQRPIFRFLATFSLSPAQREELAQEAFLRVFRHLDDFDSSRATFSSWLFTIAKNLAANELARVSHRQERLVDPLPEPAQDAVTSPPLSQHAALEKAEQESLALRALGTLPLVFRNAVALAYLQELSLDDIAAIEQCSVGTVKSRIFRGKQMLREALARSED
jgi:RNA polymerase sigma-70 factor (ECF subfamily)